MFQSPRLDDFYSLNLREQARYIEIYNDFIEFGYFEKDNPNLLDVHKCIVAGKDKYQFKELSNNVSELILLQVHQGMRNNCI